MAKVSAHRLVDRGNLRSSARLIRWILANRLMKDPADLVITDLRLPGTAADAIAITAGRIAAIGAAEAISEQIGPQTRVLQGKSAHLRPGFVESHVHLFSGGATLQQLNLSAVFGAEDLSHALHNFAKARPGNDLLQAYAANYTILGTDRPTRHDLDRILPSAACWTAMSPSAPPTARAIAATGLNTSTPSTPMTCRDWQSLAS